eukprot:TRINITY_DN3511_c0_g1_i7.p4 TRINITY_DN3511_c0_g1~~TRINITY_DN3511_c0_g1_i7.p4  ORF type:complete len:127 (+),score=25.05 TRINITY_DN3511_c0_g1_i7:76-456(+)
MVAPQQPIVDQTKSSEVLVDVREGKNKESVTDGDVMFGAKRVAPRRLVMDPVSQFSDKNASYVLCCDTGMRSKVACMAMRNNGFSNVQFMALRTTHAHTTDFKSVKSVMDSRNSFLPFAAEATLKM